MMMMEAHIGGSDGKQAKKQALMMLMKKMFGLMKDNYGDKPMDEIPPDAMSQDESPDHESIGGMPSRLMGDKDPSPEQASLMDQTRDFMKKRAISGGKSAMMDQSSHDFNLDPDADTDHTPPAFAKKYRGRGGRM